MRTNKNNIGELPREVSMKPKTFYRIKIGDIELYKMGPKSQDGAVAMKHEYEQGLPSLGHYYPNTGINRHGVLLVPKDKIEWCEKVKITPNPAAMFRAMDSFMMGRW